MSSEDPFLADLTLFYAGGPLVLLHCEACDLVYFPSDTIRCTRCGKATVHLVGVCDWCRNLYIPPARREDSG